jgi:Antidote-toxin recognition MazE, bacterial antitoxin
MTRTRARVRRWGSSLGIVVPREIVKELHLEAGREVVIDIDRAGIEEAFGSLKDWAVDPQKLKDELRRGW